MSAVESPAVVHVLWSGGVGGIERFVHDLSREQHRLGVDVSVAFGTATGPFADALADAGLPPVDLLLKSGYDVRPTALSRASRLLRRGEVIHLHAFNGPLALSAMAARRPIVFTDHGYAPHGGAHSARKRAVGAAPFKQRLMRRFLHRCPRAIAANSQYTAALMHRLHGVPRPSIEVVPNGLDFTRLGKEPRPERHEGRPLVAAFVGRLAAFKRIDRVIEAAARADVPRGLRLLVVGEGPLEAELRARARRLGVEGTVRFLGHRTDVAEVLGSVDVLLHASVGEPFGLAIVEACACGVLPVVFRDGGGALEVLPPDGLVVDTIDDLAAVLAELPGSPPLSLPGRQARASWARERFPIEAAAARYLELYRSAAGASSRS